MSTAEWIERCFQPAKDGESVEAEAVDMQGAVPDALGRALESLYPAGCLERIATMTDAEIEKYARRYGVTGAELMAGIFDPAKNAEYQRWTQGRR